MCAAVRGSVCVCVRVRVCVCVCVARAARARERAAKRARCAHLSKYSAARHAPAPWRAYTIYIYNIMNKYNIYNIMNK